MQTFSYEPLNEEQQKLASTLEDFAASMMNRLWQKYHEGKRGWDIPNWNVSEAIAVEALAVTKEAMVPEVRARKCVDLANYAMMAWYRMNELSKEATE